MRNYVNIFKSNKTNKFSSSKIYASLLEDQNSIICLENVLQDTENRFLIPNQRKKYSASENSDMKLDADGGIAIHIATEKPENVSEENWLPINRGDYGIDIIMRLYALDLGRFQNWSAPKAEMIGRLPWLCASTGLTRKSLMASRSQQRFRRHNNQKLVN